MGACITQIKRHKGHDIYLSAKTHPGAKTRSLMVFVSDVELRRFRYTVGDKISFTLALLKCVDIINKITDPAPDTGQ